MVPCIYSMAENDLPRAGEALDAFDIHFTCCFGTRGVMIEIVGSVGEVRVLTVVAAHVCGRVVNPLMFRGRCREVL